MKLQPHIIQLEPIRTEFETLLWDATELVNLDDPASLTKEEAFFDSCNRYDAQTAFFNAEHNYFSGVLPSSAVTEKLAPYLTYLTNAVLPYHTIFRCQVVRNIPGRCVRPHIDPRLYHEFSHRIHAVLDTNDRCGHVYFDENDGYKMEVNAMKAGYLYDFDNITPHSAFNLGTTDRLHIITDVIPTAFMEKYRHIFEENPNFVRGGVKDSYYRHVEGVKARYGDDEGLKQTYLNYLATGVLT